MALACPHCEAPIGDDVTRCPKCGADVDPCRTIPPAGRRMNAPLKPSAPLGRSSRPEREERSGDEEAPAAQPVRKKVKTRPPAPREHAAPQPPQSSGLRVPSSAPPPGPPRVGPSGSYPKPGTSDYYLASQQPSDEVARGAGPQDAPGGLRGWMIRMLGGAPQPAPAAAAPPPAPNLATPPSPYYAYPPQGTSPPPPPGPYPQAPFRWPEQPPQQPPDYPAPPQAGPPGAPPYYQPEPPRPPTPPPFLPDMGEDDGKTRFLGGVNIDKLKIPKYTYTLQILDNHGQWRDWGPIHASGLNVGRAKNSSDFPGLGSMAVRHMKFRYDRGGLMVEDLGSVNGIYIRLTRPVEMIDGMRFRVGNQTVEFHEPGPFDPVPPLVGEDGEEYCSRDVEPLAFLDLIRPNGQPGLRFPITRTDVTVIGREGTNTHIALSHDNSVSGMHARLYRDDSKFFLEDLKSRNGTFIHVLGASKVSSGDVILAGLVLFRVIDHGGG